MYNHGHNNLIGISPGETIAYACDALDALSCADLEGVGEDTMHGYHMLMYHIRDALRWEGERVKFERMTEEEIARNKAKLDAHIARVNAECEAETVTTFDAGTLDMIREIDSLTDEQKELVVELMQGMLRANAQEAAE